jgi:hypothetical protein
MTDSTNLIDRIAPEIERAIEAHDLGDAPLWVCGMFIMPGPDGQPAMQGYLTITISTPIVGEPEPTGTVVLNLRVLLDPQECDKVVGDLLYRCREIRSSQISEAHSAFAAENPMATDFDFSGLLKK